MSNATFSQNAEQIRFAAPTGFGGWFDRAARDRWDDVRISCSGMPSTSNIAPAVRRPIWKQPDGADV